MVFQQSGFFFADIIAPFAGIALRINAVQRLLLAVL